MNTNLAQQPAPDTNPKVINFPVRAIEAESSTNPLDQISQGKTLRQQIRDTIAVFSMLLFIIAGFKLFHDSGRLTRWIPAAVVVALAFKGRTEFAVIVAAFFAAIGFFLYGNAASFVPYTLIASATILFALGYLVPQAMKPIHLGWMWFAKKLELVMTFLILGVAWLAMFVPVGLLMKIRGGIKNFEKPESPVDSYWEIPKVGRADFKLLERQF